MTEQTDWLTREEIQREIEICNGAWFSMGGMGNTFRAKYLTLCRMALAALDGKGDHKA